MCSRWTTGSPCSFACTLINVRPRGCDTSSSDEKCLWCADVPENECDSAYFDDPWAIDTASLRRCELTASGCRAADTGIVCSSGAVVCSNRCLSRTCQELRNPPKGVQPIVCSQLRYLGCNCDGCCLEDGSAGTVTLAPAAFPPPPPPRGRFRLDVLNTWWKRGNPSNKVTEAGVLVRQFDALSIGNPWEPCSNRSWCAKYAGIFPSSLINARHNRLYRGDSEGGLVLAPPPLNRFFCSEWSVDP